MTNENASDLRFVGLHQDGEHLILATPDGNQHRLAITEMVRAAVRRDRPALEQLKNEASGFLPPREIQAQIRAGMTAQEVADQAGISITQVHRYEGPVLAERAFMAGTARDTKLSQDPGSPTLGEIVTDRLAHRGIDLSSLSWDSYRTEAHGWIIHASFYADGQSKIAKWSFDNAQGILHALENEARWLSETSLSEPTAPRHLTAVKSAVYDVEAEPVEQLSSVVSPVGQETENLLDQLEARRGKRPEDFESVDHYDDSPGEQPDPKYGRLYSLTTAAPETLADHDAVIDQPVAALESDKPSENESGLPADQSEEALLEGESQEVQSPQLLADIFGNTPDEATVSRPGRKGKKQRTRMPSWDEIMFGAKPE